jgi:hypothetical protein
MEILTRTMINLEIFKKYVTVNQISFLADVDKSINVDKLTGYLLIISLFLFIL